MGTGINLHASLTCGNSSMGCKTSKKVVEVPDRFRNRPVKAKGHWQKLGKVVRTPFWKRRKDHLKRNPGHSMTPMVTPVRPKQIDNKRGIVGDRVFFESFEDNSSIPEVAPPGGHPKTRVARESAV